MNKLFTVLFVALLSFAMFAQEDAVRKGTADSYRNEPATVIYKDVVLFEDLFNGSNEIADLQARGYVVRNHDGGGTAAAWFTPTGTVFPAYEGPAAGFVASNYQGANNYYIDHWLISPLVTVQVGDTLSFYHRSPDANQWDDSLYVRFSPTGDTAMSSFTVSRPRFCTGEAGWQLYTTTFPTSGAVRFAIQYQIFDGGTNGNYSNYLGIDVLRVIGNVVPVELTSFNAISNNNNITLNWTTVTEKNNSGFQIERNSGNGFERVAFVAGNGTTTEIKNYSFEDKNLAPGNYSYRLKQIDFNGAFEYSQTVEAEVVGLKEFTLDQNYPNPFNPSTVISFNIPVESEVRLSVVNILGQEVASLLNGKVAAGLQTVPFNATGLNSGVYFYQLEAKAIDGQVFNSTKKMILTK